MKENFKLYSKYYDLLYKDKDYKLESDYVYNKLIQFNSNIKSLLELGCGSGGHAEFLAKNFESTTGIDLSQQMIDEALNKNILKFDAKVGNITDFKLDRKYDCAIALFHVISYLENNVDLINCFNCVRDHLEDGGLFLFDFWYTPCVLNLKPINRIKRFIDKEVEIVRIAEPVIDSSRNIVNVNFDVFVQDTLNNKVERIKELHVMRHFSLPELELLAIHSGFLLVSKEEFLTGNNASETTWGVSVVFKKM
jgi:SAM-dependent methyltransferase